MLGFDCWGPVMLPSPSPLGLSYRSGADFEVAGSLSHRVE